MKLVADTNRIIAALIKDSTSRKILLNKNFQFTSIVFTKTEIKKHEEEILQKSRLSEQEYAELFEKLFKKIELVDEKDIKTQFVKKGIKIMKNIDESDSLFVAIALQEKCAVWSDDKHFLKQKKVKVLTTKELILQLTD